MDLTACRNTYYVPSPKPDATSGAHKRQHHSSVTPGTREREPQPRRSGHLACRPTTSWSGSSFQDRCPTALSRWFEGGRTDVWKVGATVSRPARLTTAALRATDGRPQGLVTAAL